jgi:hypothetical protein
VPIAVIRLLFWVEVLMVASVNSLVFQILVRLRVRLQDSFFEKLHQPINQAALAADHVQSTFVPVLFQYLAEVAL